MIILKNIIKKYDEKLIINNLNLQIDDDVITVFIGPSGAGKTTLLNIISGLTDYEGEIIFDKYNNSPVFSYCFQEDRLLNHLTVYENILFVLKKEDIDVSYIDCILKKLKIYDLKHTKVNKLSGGQRQRASIARSIIYPSDIILMDEPFKSLDCNIKYSIISDLIDILNEYPKTLIIVTHDIEEAYLLADRVVIFSSLPLTIKDELKVDLPKKDRLHNENSAKDFLNFVRKILD